MERLPLDERTWRRDHAQAWYAVQVHSPADRALTRRDVYVSGQGLGYLGAHSLAIAAHLLAYVPEIYGLDAGLLFREWIPEDNRVSRTDGASIANDLGEYIAARARAFPAPQDLSLRLADRDPVWQLAAYILGRAFRRASPAVRPLLQRAACRLLRMSRPSIVDGSTRLSRWFRREAGGLQKIEFAEHAFSNLDRACFDPAYDVAGVIADLGDDNAAAPIRSAYERATGERIHPEHGAWKTPATARPSTCPRDRTLLASSGHLAQQVVPTLLVKDACAGGEALHPPLYSFQPIQAASVGTRMRPPLCSSA